MPGSCVRYGSIVWSAGGGWISQVLRRMSSSWRLTHPSRSRRCSPVTADVTLAHRW